MSYTPGESYYGLTAGVYNELAAAYGSAFDFENNFDAVAGGKYYIFNGDWADYFDFLVELGLDEDETYGLGLFVYMNSTWNMGGY